MMTDLAPVPALPRDVQEAVMSWRRIVRACGDEHKKAKFAEACGELLPFARTKGDEVYQNVVDLLQQIAFSNDIDADAAQAIMAGATSRPTPRPGTTTGPANDALRQGPGPAIDFAPYPFPDPKSIPPREWLFGKHYIRGVVSATIGAPGRLKSTTDLTESIGMAMGRDLMTGEPLPSGPLRAAYLNGEETQDELDRRVAAICQFFDISPMDCGDRLFVISTREKLIRVAVRNLRGDAMVQQAVVDAWKDWCDRYQIDALTIDPLISFHAVRESDNGDMDLVVKEAFAVIAGNKRAVDLVMHVRKLAPGESNTTVDDARGASAILAAVRVARTFNFMTTVEAKQIGIHEGDRRRYVRVENGRSAPGPVGKAHWLKIETELLPNGDEVACATPWKVPNPFDGITTADTELARELAQTGAYRADSRSQDWFGYAIAKHLKISVSPGGKNDRKDLARLKTILETWHKNKVFAIKPRRDEERKKRKFIVAASLESSSAPAFDDDDDNEEENL
jgi:hypothetical protein